MPPKSPPAKQESAAVNPMWGGHYTRPPAALMQEINASIGFDKALWSQDIDGSLAHVVMLGETGILEIEEVETIIGGLQQVAKEIEAGQMVWDDALEDIHMHVESRLKEIVGDVAGKLHTARSRNDQVATDFRLYVRQACESLGHSLVGLIHALTDRAEEHAATIMPGFTHFQPAQPVTLGHHLMAYAEMFSRDFSRFHDAYERLNECPLGAAALAGTSFPIDREMTADALGFERPMANSLDAVSARDFALEFLSTCAIAATHLSRLAEEMIVFASPIVGFLRFSEAYTSGSSIMPQKRNPDAAELVRGKAGRIHGALHALLTTVKGLPLAYNKDLQEDKEPVFDAHRQLALCLEATAGMVRDFTADEAKLLAAASSGYSTATDLADWLVRTLKMPFRDAHHVTGRIVRLAEGKGVMLSGLSLAEMQSVEARIDDTIFGVLTPEHSVASRKSYGGTAPERVREQIAAMKERFGF